MPDKWVTLAQAAAALKVHPRTVERQIKNGKLQSRRTDAGQLEVSVDLPEESTTASEALAVVAGQADNQVQLALGATSALVKAAQEDAHLARTETLRAWSEARIARRGAGVAWATLGIMSAGLMVAVGWASSTMTHSKDEVRHSSFQIQQLSDTVVQLSATRDQLRGDLEVANVKRAHAEGELAARQMAALRQNAPTTRPAGFIDRIANLLSGALSDTPGGQ